jgi:DNA-binding MarR family transcriptional regulator
VTVHPSAALPLLERVVMGSVGVTARVVAEGAPELTLLQWRVLVVLADAPDGATVSELAGRIGSRLPATSRLVGRMRQRGLVETRKDHPDARVTTVLLGGGGRELWQRVVASRRAELVAVLAAAAFTQHDRPGLERLARAMEPYL